ncbi:hypothetical protein [Streptomyces sp. NPDC048639]|uniref:hypothetical protein n=1 Tax=Streptomyces sp. NPDC048639 TaxID=3365581 RepID=UPI00371B6C1B
MIWWLRAHAIFACAATVLLCFTIAPLLGSSALPVPSLFGGLSAGIPVPLVLPVFPACVLLYGLSRGLAEMDATAVRPMTTWSVSMLTAAGAAAALLGIAEAQLLDFPLGLAVARNTLGYLGVGLIVQRIAGDRHGTIAVAALPLICAFIGLGPGGRPYAWTWPLHTADSALAGVAALLLFVTGLMTATSRPRPS